MGSLGVDVPRLHGAGASRPASTRVVDSRFSATLFGRRSSIAQDIHRFSRRRASPQGVFSAGPTPCAHPYELLPRRRSGHLSASATDRGSIQETEAPSPLVPSAKPRAPPPPQAVAAAAVAAGSSARSSAAADSLALETGRDTGVPQPPGEPKIPSPPQRIPQQEPGRFRAPEVEIGFTRRNELLVGRVAMLGFGASLVGELLTGKGPLAQLKLETGIPIYDAEPLLLFFILFTLVGAVRGIDSSSCTLFHRDAETGQVRPRQEKKSIRGFFGLPETGPLFSFSKPNELFVGRMAQLGFACALIGELVTGKGALAQLRIETGIPVTEVEPLIILSIAFFFLSAINPETGRFFRNDNDGDEE